MLDLQRVSRLQSSMPTRIPAPASLALVLALSLAAPGEPLAAQRAAGPRTPTTVGVSPRAVGPAAPTPAPIGGLRTRPLNEPGPHLYDRSSRVPRVGDRDAPRDGHRDRPRDGYRDGYRNGYRDGFRYPVDAYGLSYGYAVPDAPLPRGAVVYSGITPGNATRDNGVRTRSWFPTADRPRWRVDSTLAPVQAWRDLIVSDTVCDGAGTCINREQRMRAPWVPVCRCYLFTDALGRRWEVE